MKRLMLILISIAFLSGLFFGCATIELPETAEQKDTAVPGKEYHLAVLHTNDFHGHPVKFFNYPAPDVGGLPAIATFTRGMRAAFDYVLMVDAGDLNTGRPESNFFKAEPDIIGYNHVGYDVMVLGNHEFDNPLDVLAKQRELADFPFISANVKTADGSPLVEPYIIKEFDGVRVGIFGLTLKNTDNVGNPDIVQDLIFEDEVTTARKMVEELRDKVDVLIALTHLGIYSSNEKGSRRVAANVDGIDLIIDGHTHSKLDEPVIENGTPIVQAWHWGLNVGKSEFVIQDRKIKSFSWNAVPINLKNRIKKDDGTRAYPFIGREIIEDQKLVTLLQPYVDKVDEVLAEVIGTATGTFLNTNVRKQETALGDMVADSMLWYTQSLGADFAIQNGGGIRADLPAGDIPKRLIYEILPFDNSVMVMTLKGSDVQALFDYIATIPQGKGAFAQVSEGVSYTVNYISGKCENVLINGEPIDLAREYKVTTNSYMASGGDGYKMFKNAVEAYDTSFFQRDAFIEYVIELGGTITPEIKNRIHIVGSQAALLLKKVFDLAA